MTDETSSSSSTTTSTLQFQQSTKLQRRSSSAAVPNSISSSQNANLMMPPPPSLTTANGISTRGGPIIKSQTKNLSSSPSPIRYAFLFKKPEGGVWLLVGSVFSIESCVFYYYLFRSWIHSFRKRKRKRLRYFFSFWEIGVIILVMVAVWSSTELQTRLNWWRAEIDFSSKKFPLLPLF